MKKANILPADTYVVLNKTILNNNDRQILSMLYQPIIGYLPISLYFTLWSDLDNIEIMSIEFTHHHLMSKMQLDLKEIINAREKLEAMGLLKSYYKKNDNTNSYVYQLYSPLAAVDFLKDPLLNVLLYSNVGANEYNRVINYFKIPNISLEGFEEITTSFSDVFETTPNDQTNVGEELKKRTTNNINIKNKIDFDLLESSISSSLLSKKAFDDKTKSLLNKLSFLYSLDSINMINIVKGSINDKGFIDKEKIRTACRNFYLFENANKLPNIIYRSQPENYQKKDLDQSKRSKIIWTFDNLSPYDFLRAKYNGGAPTNRDKQLVESLLVEQNLNPGVVNVLIDYIIKINNNKLNKNFVETIAGQWKRANIKTAEEAMNQAEKEHKKYKTKISSTVKNTSKEKKLPEWFNKEIKEETLSLDEEAKMKDLLKEFT